MKKQIVIIAVIIASIQPINTYAKIEHTSRSYREYMMRKKYEELKEKREKAKREPLQVFLEDMGGAYGLCDYCIIDGKLGMYGHVRWWKKIHNMMPDVEAKLKSIDSNGLALMQIRNSDQRFYLLASDLAQSGIEGYHTFGGWHPLVLASDKKYAWSDQESYSVDSKTTYDSNGTKGYFNAKSDITISREGGFTKIYKEVDIRKWCYPLTFDLYKKLIAKGVKIPAIKDYPKYAGYNNDPKSTLYKSVNMIDVKKELKEIAIDEINKKKKEEADRLKRLTEW